MRDFAIATTPVEQFEAAARAYLPKRQALLEACSGAGLQPGATIHFDLKLSHDVILAKATFDAAALALAMSLVAMPEVPSHG